VLDDAVRNMLEQGASLGLQFVLANQDISQLHIGERNYLPTVVGELWQQDHSEFARQSVPGAADEAQRRKGDSLPEV